MLWKWTQVTKQSTPDPWHAVNGHGICKNTAKKLSLHNWRDSCPQIRGKKGWHEWHPWISMRYSFSSTALLLLLSWVGSSGTFWRLYASLTRCFQGSEQILFALGEPCLPSGQSCFLVFTLTGAILPTFLTPDTFLCIRVLILYSISISLHSKTRPSRYQTDSLMQSHHVTCEWFSLALTELYHTQVGVIWADISGA